MVPADVRRDLLRAARSVQLDGPRVRVEGLDAGRLDAAAFVEVLADALYSRWFAGHGAHVAAPVAADDTLVARLRAAHVAGDRFDSGWVAMVSAGAILAARDGQWHRLESLHHVNLTARAAPVRPGDALALSRLRDVVDTASGWWMADGGAGPASAIPFVRIYWNGDAAVAAELVHRVTRVLDELADPYTLKCPVTAPLFDRREPIVLYVERATWLRARRALRAVHAAVAPDLREPVPPLTLRLGRGVALAEDPGDGRSFGQSRATAVAAALAPLLSVGALDDDEIVAALAAGLAAHGISPARPYLPDDAPDADWSW
jgi:hypothetical protein